MTESHIAGITVSWDGRYLRQRCSWCGHVLLDYDLTKVAVMVPPDGSDPEPPATWPVGAVIRTDGFMSSILVEPTEVAKLAEVAPDACVFLDPEITR